MDVPSYHKVLIVTDAAITIAPSLEEKADICRNAIDLAGNRPFWRCRERPEAPFDGFARASGNPPLWSVGKPRITAIRLPAQESLFDEEIEHGPTRRAFVAAQPLRLRDREAQARHFEILGADSRQQHVRHTNLQCNHAGRFGRSWAEVTSVSTGT
jgi:hypothetical protein